MIYLRVKILEYNYIRNILKLGSSKGKIEFWKLKWCLKWERINIRCFLKKVNFELNLEEIIVE